LSEADEGGETVKHNCVEDACSICTDEIRAELVLAKADLNARLTSTVHELGGSVEGLPTGKHNFLQRIRELRRMELQMEEWRPIVEAATEVYALRSEAMAKAHSQQETARLFEKYKERHQEVCDRLDEAVKAFLQKKNCVRCGQRTPCPIHNKGL
jgi:hypothetical protein